MDEIVIGVLQLALLAAPGGPDGIDVCGLFSSIFSWILRIIAGGGSLFLLIDMAGHVFRSPRDLRAAGLETLGLAILIAAASKADVFVRWSFTLLGATAQCTPIP